MTSQLPPAVSIAVSISIVTIVINSIALPVILSEISTTWRELDQQLEDVKNLRTAISHDLYIMQRSGITRERLERAKRAIISQVSDESKKKKRTVVRRKIVHKTRSSADQRLWKKDPFDLDFEEDITKANCVCVLHNTCDAGPAGPAGVPGVKGPNGPDGIDGTPGIDVGDVYEIPAPQDCFVCPQGEPGPPGQRGQPGVRGNYGVQGPSGTHGFPGSPGQRGPDGDQGEDGSDGPIGPRGERGRHGRRYLSKPGPKGLEGLPGFRGSQGEPGETIVEMGPVGVPGPPGRRGVQGRKGEDGVRGAPGAQSQECQCIIYPKTKLTGLKKDETTEKARDGYTGDIRKKIDQINTDKVIIRRHPVSSSRFPRPLNFLKVGNNVLPIKSLKNNTHQYKESGLVHLRTVVSPVPPSQSPHAPSNDSATLVLPQMSLVDPSHDPHHVSMSHTPLHVLPKAPKRPVTAEEFSKKLKLRRQLKPLIPANSLEFGRDPFGYSPTRTTIPMDDVTPAALNVLPRKVHRRRKVLLEEIARKLLTTTEIPMEVKKFNENRLKTPFVDFSTDYETKLKNLRRRRRLRLHNTVNGSSHLSSTHKIIRLGN